MFLGNVEKCIGNLCVGNLFHISMINISLTNPFPVDAASQWCCLFWCVDSCKKVCKICYCCVCWVWRQSYAMSRDNNGRPSDWSLFTGCKILDSCSPCYCMHPSDELHSKSTPIFHSRSVNRPFDHCATLLSYLFLYAPGNFIFVM